LIIGDGNQFMRKVNVVKTSSQILNICEE
jgi:hypothetical protein